jgi:hypothetical protein
VVGAVRPLGADSLQFLRLRVASTLLHLLFLPALFTAKDPVCHRESSKTCDVDPRGPVDKDNVGYLLTAVLALHALLSFLPFPWAGDG